MSINPLIPAYAEVRWDGLIPSVMLFERDYIFVEFTEDSTRAVIQSLRLHLEIYCCSSISSGECEEEINEQPPLRIFATVQTKRKRLWKTTATSIILHDNDVFFQCGDRFVNNKCLGLYDSQTVDIDVYNTLFIWQNLSIVTEGLLTDTLLHDRVIIDRNPCERNLGIISLGQNIITSLIAS